MEAKVCNRCKQSKKLDEFGINRIMKAGHHSTCKRCRAANERQRRLDPEVRRKKKEEFKIWYWNGGKEIKKLSRQKNRDRFRLYARNQSKRDKANMVDSYIKRLLVISAPDLLGIKEMPKELIRLKRAQLKLYRAIYK